MKYDSQSYQITERGSFGKIVLIIGIIGLLLSLIGYFTDKAQFFHSYLVAFVFWTSIALGALFFTMLHHLVNAKWSVILRRLSENVMAVLPIMALFFIPLLFGIHELFHWSHEEAVAHDPLLQQKAPYLNTTFFIIRAVAYFAIWFILARALFRLSIRQDSGHDESIFRKMRVISAPGTILFALTLTFASFDWLMSLDAHWYSTIFGVYIFAGALLAFLAFLSFTTFSLRSNGVLKDKITEEHDHDLGKLIFAFTVFWGYMAFSQYFLIWYGNIPEETIWFIHRWEESWKIISLIIIFGRFGVPFFLLFPRAPKRNAGFMKIMTIWILLMHWVDLYWIVMPNLHKHSVHLSWMDLTTMVGIGGIFLWYFYRKLTAVPVVPVADPGLKKSIQFINY